MDEREKKYIRGYNYFKLQILDLKHNANFDKVSKLNPLKNLPKLKGFIYNQNLDFIFCKPQIFLLLPHLRCLGTIL